jgi:putative inorganic carbon (hco3(-)) transporter
VIFRLFLLLNAVLLLRPEDLRPELAGLHLYLGLIVVCLVGAAPAFVDQLMPWNLADRPVALCVLGFFGSAVLALLARGWVGQALADGFEFAKVGAYYLLLVAVVNRPERIRMFLGSLVVIVAGLAALGLAQFYGVIDWEVLRPVAQIDYDEISGEVLASYPRLCAVGIFNDPNDFCLILTAGILACLARSTTADGLGRLGWLAPIGLFGPALMLTQSRGGMLGLAAGIGTLVVVRLGPRRGLPFAALGVLAFLVMFGGRQANLSLGNGDTSQERLRLWAEGLALLQRNPLTGIGPGEYADEVGMVAHNSFVQAFVECGLIGGTLYVGAFVMAVVGLARLARHRAFWEHDRTFTALRPFVLAMVVAYAAGTFSLSRNYVVPTYLILGLATAYHQVALPRVPADERMSRTVAVRLLLLGVGTLVFLKVFTSLLVRFT